MTNEQHGSPALRYVAHLTQTFLLKLCITDCQDFVHYQNLRLQVRGNRESETYIHAGGITFNRGIKKLFDFRKSYDLVKLSLDLRLPHAKQRAIQIDVLTPGQFGMKASAHLKQTCHPSVKID